MAMDSASSKTFVDALYRKVLLAVKASNAVPTEDDDFQYHARFSEAFAAHVASSGAKAEQLVWQLARVDKKRKARSSADDSDSDDDDDHNSNGKELFDGPEPTSRITDFVDALLDDASKQLELFQRGESSASATSASSSLRPLENKPLSFGKQPTGDKTDTKDNQTTPATTNRFNRGMAKPQVQFDEPIDNSDAPFASKLREKVHALPRDSASMDMDDIDNMDDNALHQRQHPYYAEITALKYANWQLEAAATPYQKIPIEDASYLWVDTDETLASMVATLTQPDTKVIGVDLEHHSYRSYLGLVCLMQISTATCDFLVDTLALRSKLQVLNRVFCNPQVVKVLHGSDSDILWLQRDLGLYIVNLFDTGQAARLLQYPRFSLAYLLKRHCDVDADKQYQLADWRVRPLDRHMVQYAREDTRYLLFIYDTMKRELLATGRTNAQSSLLMDALRRSQQLSLQVFVKPRVSDIECDGLCSRLQATAGLPMPLSTLQQRVFALLFEWRDRVARLEDESTGYVLPNQVLVKLVAHAPTTSEQLVRLCNPVPPLVRKYAQELTAQISKERQQIAKEEAKAVAKAPATAGKKSSDDAQAGENDSKNAPSATAAAASSSHLSAYASWQRGKRSATCAGTEDATVASSGLRASFATLSTYATSPAAAVEDVENNASVSTAAATLERINALVARTAFTVTEHDTSVAAGGATAAPIQPAAAPAVAVPHVDALPQSIAETYQMTHRTKRQKTLSDNSTDASSAVASSAAVGVKDNAAAEPPATTTSANASVFQAFDYSAASEQVAGAKFDLADATRTNERRDNKKKRGVKQAGGSYNPFVAVRSAAAGSASGGGRNGDGDDAPEELFGAKKAIKKMHHMPRSATFR